VFIQLRAELYLSGSGCGSKCRIDASAGDASAVHSLIESELRTILAFRPAM
jgi:hypothetical protein